MRHGRSLLMRSSRVILLPQEVYDHRQTYLEKNFLRIFELELDAWVPDRHLWPKNMDYAAFQQWFDVEFYALVMDDAKIELSREPYD